MRYVLILVCLLAGCNFGPSPSSDLGGGPPTVDGLPTIHLPFPAGTVWRCTQGAGGSYSHSYNSTRYDVDLDTPNHPNSSTTVYAPMGGAVYVHEDSGFGLHVNIDHGDGTYTLLGHFSQVWVANDTWVELGEPLGLDGCTGACTGDHVHLGVHSGTASRPAGQGQSIPFAVFAADTNVSKRPAAHSTQSMICGLTQGHFYESQLPVWSDEQGESPDPMDDDDAVDPPADDDDATPEPADDDDVEEPNGSHGVVELCWQPDGLVNPHDAELWVWYGGWQTVDSVYGNVSQLCGTVEADPGDVLLVNGQFEASNVLSNPWWMCSNWGSAGGMVVHGTFFVNGIAVATADVDNGVDGCNVQLVLP